MEIEEILEKLFGQIYPYGSTEIDEKRYNNLENYKKALNFIVDKLVECASFNNDNRFSCNNIGSKAYDILNGRKDIIEECLRLNKGEDENV